MEHTEQESFWTKELLATFGVNFFIIIIYFMLLVTISGYTIDTFHTSTSIAGLVAGMMVIGSLIGRFFTGYIIHFLGIRKVLIIGTLFFLITMLLHLMVTNIELLMLLRLLSGVAVGLIGTATGTVVALIVPHHRRGEGISYFSMTTILGNAFGPFLGITLLLYVPFYVLFILGFIFGLVALALSLPITINHPPRAASENSSHWNIRNFISPEALPISIVIFLVALNHSGVQTYIAFYAKDLDIAAYAGVFFFVYAVVVLLSRPFTGKILDSRGENIIALPALILFSIGLFILSQATTSFMLLLSAVFIGLGFGNFQSTSQAIAVKVAPPQNISQATSTFFICYDIALGFGPYALGAMIPMIGYSNLYFSLSFFALFCIIPYWYLHGRKKVHPYYEEEN